MESLQDKLRVPQGATPYILYQRTDYMLSGKSRVTGKLLTMVPGWCYESIVGLEALLGKQRIEDAYGRDMLGEYREIASFLPPNAANILDIGSGMAGIDVFLNCHYVEQNEQPNFHLLDKTQKNRRVFYGFKTNAAFYNSLSLSKALLHVNGVPLENIHLLEAVPTNQIETNEKFDLVLSLISWGFHYPVSTYLQEVERLLSENGCIILDIRNNTEGITEVQRYFQHIEIISKSASKTRIWASR